MQHEHVQQLILDGGWRRDDLEEAAAILAHVRDCPECAKALADYDLLRSQLSEQPEEDACPPGGWDAFENRLSMHPKAQTLNGMRTKRWWSGGAAIAAALVVVAGVVAWMLSRQPVDGPQIATIETPAMTKFLPDAAAEQVGAFETLSRMFDGKAGWVALSNGDSNMGLTQRPIAMNEGQRLMVLRLTIAGGASSDAVLTQTDLIILPGQKADLAIPLDQGRTVNYQISVSKVHPNRLALWAEIAGDDPQDHPAEAVAANLDLRADQVADAGGLMTDAGRYQLKVGLREADWKGVN